MRLRELMNTRMETIPRDATAAEALARMQQRRIRHLIVTDVGKVVGIVSDRDLKNLGSMGTVETTGDHMTHPVVTASPETTVRKAANLLRGRAIGCLPVIEGDRVVGIVTTTDLLELLGHGDRRPAPKSGRRILRGRGAGRRAPGPHAARRHAAGR